MRKMLDAVAAPGGSYVKLARSVAVAVMLVVIGSQIYQAGVKEGREGRQPEVDALVATNAKLSAAAAAYKTSLGIQNQMSLVLVKDAKVLQAAASAANQATTVALQESADLRRRLRLAASRPAAGDAPIDDLNKEAWEAVRCARGGC